MKCTFIFTCCLALTAGFSWPLQGQDIYDQAHTRKFAQYLLQARQYPAAAEEYERLAFMAPQNDTFRMAVLYAMRKGEQITDGLERWRRWIDNGYQPGLESRGEYAKLLLIGGQYPALRTLTTQEGLIAPRLARRLDFYALLLQQSWPEARTRLAAWPVGENLPRRKELESVLLRGEKMRLKSPALALGLSAIVPGAGKMYAGQWKDGIIGLIFVGLNTWQAWRRFDQEGLDTFWGWVHAGFALGFYTGNLYGSHKAARIENERKRHKLLHETELLVHPALD